MENLNLNSSKIILYNLTDDLLLYEKNADVQTEIASLTKIMTTIVTLENRDLNETVTIDESMISGLEEFAILGLAPGQILSVEELLYATMLPSAGDAAQALAISQSGSIANFAEIMNAKAEELGMENTHFSNPVGMDIDNHSTARDIAKLLKYSLQNENFRKIFTTFEYHISSIDKTITKTAGQDGIILGAKTGFTYDAGRCLASIAHFSDADFMLVNLNADWTTNNHITDAEKIYQYYAENYSYRNVMSVNEKYLELPVYDSATTSVDFLAKTDIKKYLANALDLNTLERKYTGVNEIRKGAKVGDYLGQYQIYNADELIYEMPVYLETEIEFYPYWLWNIGVVFGGLVLILLSVAIYRHIRKTR